MDEFGVETEVSDDLPLNAILQDPVVAEPRELLEDFLWESYN